MTAIREAFGDLLEAGLRTIFTEVTPDPSYLREKIFTVKSTSNPQEKDSSVGQFSDFDEFDGTVNYDDVYQGWDKTYSWTEYAKGFKISRSMYDDDRYNIINKKPDGLKRAAERTKEKHAASVFNEAFTTEPTDGDGAELCASDHSSNVSGVATQSNEGTTGLSATAVESTRQLMVQFKGDVGELLSVRMDALIVPTQKEEVAWEIINSSGKLDVTTNNRNFHEGKYKAFVWEFLTDSNNWFAVDTELMKKFLLWFDRVKPEFMQDKDSDTLIAKYIAYMRYGYGWSGWQWIYGHLVT